MSLNKKEQKCFLKPEDSPGRCGKKTFLPNLDIWDL